MNISILKLNRLQVSVGLLLAWQVLLVDYKKGVLFILFFLILRVCL
jgi:hypothetical protein